MDTQSREGSPVFERLLSIGWPLILVFAGLLLLAGTFGLIGRKKQDDPETVQHE